MAFNEHEELGITFGAFDGRFHNAHHMAPKGTHTLSDGLNRFFMNSGVGNDPFAFRDLDTACLKLRLHEKHEPRDGKTLFSRYCTHECFEHFGERDERKNGTLERTREWNLVALE
jgi:hypothetical protein